MGSDALTQPAAVGKSGSNTKNGQWSRNAGSRRLWCTSTARALKDGPNLRSGIHRSKDTSTGDVGSEVNGRLSGSAKDLTIGNI